MSIESSKYVSMDSSARAAAKASMSAAASAAAAKLDAQRAAASADEAEASAVSAAASSGLVSDYANAADESASSATLSASQASSSAANALESEANSKASELAAIGASNWVGDWEDGGAGVSGTSYSYENRYIYLLKTDLADISTSEPSFINNDWQLINEMPEIEIDATALVDLNFGEQEYKVYSGFDTGSESKGLTEIVDFTRSTTGTGIAGNLILATASVDVPRIVFDPETGDRQGYLNAQSYESSFLYSEDFSNSDWSKEGGVTATYDGELFTNNSISYTITKMSDSGFSSLRKLSTSAGDGETWTCFVFVKAGTISQFRTTYADDVQGAVLFDLTNGTAETTSGSATGSIYPLNNGWYLCSTTCTFSSGGGIYRALDFALTEGGVGDYLYAYASQFTQTPFAMPYVKTEGSAVIAGADSMSRTLTGDELNSGSFTLYMEVKCIGYQGNQFFYSFTDASNAYVLGAYTNTSSRQYGDYDWFKYAASVTDDGTVTEYIDGVKSSEVSYIDTSSIARLNIGYRTSTVTGNFGPHNGYIRKVRLYNKALSEAEAEELTRL